MGALYRFRCNQCDYEFIGSGERDRGFFSVTDTFECTTCEILFDATVKSCMGDFDDDNSDIYSEPVANDAPLAWQIVEVRCPKCKEMWPLKTWSAEHDGHCPHNACSGIMQNIALHSMWD